ncbi:MAG: AbrB family transcriptional regulator [Selenomonadaceae bacterium]|nr:AbrB family transcriptional regulator [Selenomonadaceae bacterium]
MKEFTKQRFLLFAAAAACGFLFHTLQIPIPYIIGGILASFVAKTFIDPKTHWPALWRNVMMCVAGYEIGRSCSLDTLINLAHEVPGVLTATTVTIFVSIMMAFWTFKHSESNLISCVMGCSPGGMSLMTLMAEEDPRADMNVVVVAQALRLFSVVLSVPFLAMQMLDESSTAVAIEKVDELPWMILIPICFAGWFIGKKIHLPTKQLLGPIIIAGLFATLVYPLEEAPKPLMAVVQLNIGLYIGTRLDKDRLIALKTMVPHLILGNVAMIASSVGMAIFLSKVYDFSLITAFLAMAPGGITEMCVAGLAMGANVPIILAYQLFRLLSINFISPFLINWYFKKSGEEA